MAQIPHDEAFLYIYQIKPECYNPEYFCHFYDIMVTEAPVQKIKFEIYVTFNPRGTIK